MSITQPTADGAIKNDPLARKRLSVLELTKELGSVAEACRRSGMDHTSFYEHKRRFQLQGLEGLEGLKDLPPVARSHQQTTPDEVVQQIVALALEHPAWGCNRISDHLALGGVAIVGGNRFGWFALSSLRIRKP
jgi:hypothetical protein